MHVVIAICHKDLDSARRLLEWCSELDNRVSHDVLVVGSKTLTKRDIIEFRDEALNTFAHADSIQLPLEVASGWPVACNKMFQAACEYMAQYGNGPWLWLESDAVPLAAGWLDALETEYKRVNKPFVGTLYDSPYPHINGVAIYPKNVRAYNPHMLNGSKLPWDCVRPEVTLRYAHNTHLIQRMLAEPQTNTPMTFPDQDSLKLIRDGTILLHGCKDGTLIQRLREKRNGGGTVRRAPAEGNLKEATCLVQLGRYGDIINMLPIAKHLHETTGEKPYLVVSDEFASLLDGVSYVKPYGTGLHFSKLTEAMELANQTFGTVIRTQIYGHNFDQEQRESNHNKESWRVAGYSQHFYDPKWKPVFDQRDKKREAEIVKNLFKTSKPKIVCNLTSARTSPFAGGPSVLESLKKEFSEHEVVDIGQLRCARVYDVLGIIEKAKVFVTIDTATLHLAQATTIPTVCLLPNRGWTAAEPRINCTSWLRYYDAHPYAVVAQVRRAMESKSFQPFKRLMAMFPKKRLDLSHVTAWGCAWSDSVEHYRNTLRALRYCEKRIKFERVILFGFMRPEVVMEGEIGFDLEYIQIPRLPDFDAFNVFINRTAPMYLLRPEVKSAAYMSVHDDGFPTHLEMWQKEFLDYDYIGAVWADGVVGNGGASIESRRLMEAKLKLPPYEQLTNSPDGRGVLASDVYICRKHRPELEAMGITFAPRDIAMDFSIEQIGGRFPSFTFHGRHCQPKRFNDGWKLIEESEKE